VIDIRWGHTLTMADLVACRCRLLAIYGHS
jgi:hypothetical protein